MAIPSFFINQSQTIGMIVTQMTINSTGSLFLTYLSIVFIILLIAMVFRIPLEFTAIIVMPLLLTLMAYYSAFWTFGGIMLIYLAFLFAKHFFYSR